MSGRLEHSRIPLMPPEVGQDIARGLKWLAESYTQAGMRREASRAESDCQWWLAHAIPLAQTPPAPGRSGD
jgi:hypothetical protein